MITKTGIAMLLITIGAGAGSYLATVSLGQGRGAGQEAHGGGRGVARWLSLAPEQEKKLEATDPGFQAECRALQQELDTARDELIAALEKDSASDQEILAKVERTIDVDARLERRVIQHLLKVRTQLTPQQCRQLFEVSAEQIRQAPGYGRGHGGPPGDRGGRGKGRGGPPWRQ